jgi:hypothetical protein
VKTVVKINLGRTGDEVGQSEGAQRRRTIAKSINRKLPVTGGEGWIGYLLRLDHAVE